MDFLTGYEISLSAFYLAPVAFVAWFAGRPLGIVVAIASAVVWAVADIAAGRGFSHPVIPVWNCAVHLVFFILTAIILGKLKLAYETQIALNGELREAFDNIRVLSGLIPMCAWCKKIRDDRGYRQEVEAYLAEHSDASVTHGICPECEAKVRNEFRVIERKQPESE